MSESEQATLSDASAACWEQWIAGDSWNTRGGISNLAAGTLSGRYVVLSELVTATQTQEPQP